MVLLGRRAGRGACACTARPAPQWPLMPIWEHQLTCHGDPGERAPGRDLSAVSHQDGLAQTVRNEILKSSADRRRGVKSQGSQVLGCNHGENGVFMEETEKSESRADFDEGRW